MTTISPRVDIAFKKIFGVEENKDLLISLINSIVSTEDQVADITLLNPYNPQSFKTDKLSILDIKALGIDGKRFNIEVQISDEADYDKRALYYWAKLYIEQLKSGEDYSKLSKAIGIHILNFTSILGARDYHNRFKIKNDKTGEPYFKDLELHTIELNKFISRDENELSDLIVKIKGAIDIWLAFLTRNDLLIKDNLPKELNDPHLKKALNVLETMNFTPEERQDYEDHLKWLRMEASAVNKATKDAREEGIEIGEARGEAKLEQEKLKIARDMLKNNIDINLISQITGLNISQIKDLT
jgi:predicted transposase/invertase (TIGR01784 family)